MTTIMTMAYDNVVLLIVKSLMGCNMLMHSEPAVMILLVYCLGIVQDVCLPTMSQHEYCCC